MSSFILIFLMFTHAEVTTVADSTETRTQSSDEYCLSTFPDSSAASDYLRERSRISVPSCKIGFEFGKSLKRSPSNRGKSSADLISQCHTVYPSFNLQAECTTRRQNNIQTMYFEALALRQGCLSAVVN